MTILMGRVIGTLASTSVRLETRLDLRKSYLFAKLLITLEHAVLFNRIPDVTKCVPPRPFLKIGVVSFLFNDRELAKS